MFNQLSILTASLIATGFTSAMSTAIFGQGDQQMPESAEDLVEINISTDTESISPGETFHLAVAFEIEPKWHIYWKNPGSSGLPTEITINPPEGFTIGETRYPRPVEFRDSLGTSYGYNKEAMLFVPVTAPDTLKAGSANFDADISYFVCKGVCLTGKASREITLSTSAGKSTATDTSTDSQILEAKKRLPQPLKKSKQSSVAFDGEKLTITGPADNLQTAHFFPDPSPGVTIEKPEITVSGGLYRLVAPIRLDSGNALGEPMRLAGVVGLGEKPDDPSYYFDIPATK